MKADKPRKGGEGTLAADEQLDWDVAVRRGDRE
jgi:hypothetical protein